MTKPHTDAADLRFSPGARQVTQWGSPQAAGSLPAHRGPSARSSVGAPDGLPCCHTARVSLGRRCRATGVGDVDHSAGDQALPPPTATVAWCRVPDCASASHQGLAAKLMLVSAPAGFGKTTLLVDWMACRLRLTGGRGRPRPGSSLDAGDNDPATFWTYVIAALRTVAPDIGAAALGAAAGPPPAAVPGRADAPLLNELGAGGGRPRPAARRLPRHRLARGPCRDGLPARPPARSAAPGDRQSRRPAPAAPAAARTRRPRRGAGCRPALHRPTRRRRTSTARWDWSWTPTDVTALEGRTEGWIAALQLAALSMAGRDDVGTLHRRVRRRRPVRRRLPGRGGPATPAGGRPDVPAADLRARPHERLPVRRRHRAGRRPRRCWRPSTGTTCSWSRWTTAASGTATTTCSPTSCQARLLDEQPEQVAQLHRLASELARAERRPAPRPSGTAWPAADFAGRGRADGAGDPGAAPGPA